MVNDDRYKFRADKDKLYIYYAIFVWLVEGKLLKPHKYTLFRMYLLTIRVSLLQ